MNMYQVHAIINVAAEDKAEAEDLVLTELEQLDASVMKVERLS